MLAERVIAMARERGRLPERVEIGQVFERTLYLAQSGKEMDLGGASDHTRIRITEVPGGRRRSYRYVKVDARPRGNGRRDRQEHPITLDGLARNYKLVPAASTTKGGAGSVADFGPDGRPDCGFCAERLRVNVGLMEENRQLRRALADDPSRWSFDTLMAAADALLEERYPADVFKGGPDSDPGPRLVAALRDCRARLSSKGGDGHAA